MNTTDSWSGAVTIEVENPSGYCITQRDAVLDVLRTKNKPDNLIDVKADFPMVHWYFSKVYLERENCETFNPIWNQIYWGPENLFEATPIVVSSCLPLDLCCWFVWVAP